MLNSASLLQMIQSLLTDPVQADFDGEERTTWLNVLGKLYTAVEADATPSITHPTGMMT